MAQGRSIAKCLRCGQCCLKNPPTLHLQDINVLKTKIVTYGDLMTLRKGEMVFDNINNRLIKLNREIIKIKTKDNNTTSCLFYQEKDNACKIYEFRFLECKKLKCWDNEELIECYDKDRLTRFDIIKEDSAMGEIIKLHEEKTNIDIVLNLFYEYNKKKDKKIEEKIKDIISYDESIRTYISEKTGANRELEFFFGRPIKKILQIGGVV